MSNYSRRPVLIEQPAKRRRAGVQVGGLIALAGIVPFMIMVESDSTGAFLALLACIGLGLVVALVGRIGAWLRRG